MVCNTYGLQIITIRLRARDFYEMITIIVIMSPSVTKILLNRIRSRASNLITLATEGRPSYKMDSGFRFLSCREFAKNTKSLNQSKSSFGRLTGGCHHHEEATIMKKPSKKIQYSTLDTFPHFHVLLSINC